MMAKSSPKGANKISASRSPRTSTRTPSDATQDFSFNDVLRNQIHEAIADAFKEQSSTIEAQQRALMKQQAVFMQAVLQHVQRISETLSGLQEKSALQPSVRSAVAPMKRSTSRSSSPTSAKFPKQGVTNASANDEIELLQDTPAGDCLIEGAMLRTAELRAAEEALGGMKQSLTRAEQHLRVTIVDCRGLRNADQLSVSDPYCICKVSNKPSSERTEFRTPNVKNALNPRWQFTAMISDYTPGDSLYFRVMDKDSYKSEADDLLGEVTLASSAIQQAGGFEGDLELTNAGTGYRPLLHVSVAVVEGPAPEHLRHHVTQTFSPDLFAECEDDSDLEGVIRNREQEKLKAALIRKIPYAPMRDALTRCASFIEDVKEPPRTGRIAAIEDGKVFFTLSLLVVCADQLVTVTATNYSAAHLDPTIPVICHILENAFLGWFALEVVVKIFIHRVFFFIGEHCKMNMMDFFLVVYSAVEVVGIDLSFLRAVRIFKIAKVVRMLKALTQVRDLRVMMDCLISSWFAMFWAVVLIAFLTYMFALIFVQAMTEYAISHKDTLDSGLLDDIDKKFGSVQAGILSLFMALTGGFDWGELYDLVVLSGPVGTVTCIFFVLFFTISVWNIVGSIFVEKVMQTAKPDPREEKLELRTQARVDAFEVKSFLGECDKKARGALSMEQFVKIMESGGLAEFMALREVDLRDTAAATAFFKIAQEKFSSSHAGLGLGDKDASIEALVSTFHRVRGQASNLDVAVLRHEMSLMLHKQKELQHSLDYLVDSVGDGSPKGGMPRFCI